MPRPANHARCWMRPRGSLAVKPVLLFPHPPSTKTPRPPPKVRRRSRGGGGPRRHDGRPRGASASRHRSSASWSECRGRRERRTAGRLPRTGGWCLSIRGSGPRRRRGGARRLPEHPRPHRKREAGDPIVVEAATPETSSANRVRGLRGALPPARARPPRRHPVPGSGRFAEDGRLQAQAIQVTGWGLSPARGRFPRRASACRSRSRSRARSGRCRGGPARRGR